MVEICAGICATPIRLERPHHERQRRLLPDTRADARDRHAPQDSVDHIHTIYRDPTNDYGAKLARR
jgi:hypothetical protein